MQPRKLLRYEPKIVVRFAYINVGKNDFNFVSKSQIILGGGGWSGDGMVSVGGFFWALLCEMIGPVDIYKV